MAARLPRGACSDRRGTMDYRFSDTQRQRVEAAFAFARGELAPHSDDWDREGHFPLKAIARAAAQGYLGLSASPAHGGLGLSALDESLVLEQLASGCGATAAFIALHNVAAWTVDRFADDALKAHWLSRLCAGEVLVAFALGEATPTPLRATRDDDGYRLDGLPGAVPAAAASDLLLVDAELEDAGPTLFLLPVAAEGVGFGAEEPRSGWRALPSRPLRIDSARVAAGQRLGAEGQATEALRRARERAHLALAAVAVGNAQAALGQVLRDPRHTGVPEPSPLTVDQVPEALAEPYAALIAGQQLVRLAAGQLDDDAPQAGLLCAAAKHYTDHHGPRLCRAALQLRASSGYLNDYALDRRARDSEMHTGVQGRDEHLRAAIARRLHASQALQAPPQAAASEAAAESEAPCAAP
ncbi:acyl-CoA dehydrogenase [Pseudomonas mangiferae]|uniref:Acyl-CoA dehydrogenase n=2 Tax=Pseudomonas mangiferae TaxID=2593654 RepID=A0A553H2B3_9PSED|nr:acyl-CoA dehydrogenase [Pseudomonas mangiferae]